MRSFLALIAVSSTALSLSTRADELQLKGSASLQGQVLAEKKDVVVLDVGYTVLVVPREQIARIVRAEDADKKPQDKSKPGADAPTAGSSDNKGMYRVAKTPPPERDVRDLVKQLGEAVVQVRTPGGLGSGFILNEDGYLITNFHVVEGETSISVEVYHQKEGQLERKTYKDVRIVAMNKFADLTLLKIDDAGAPKFKPVLLGDSDALVVGEHVFAIGSPLGLERTVTEGIMSTKTRQMQGSLYLQTNAQINPGNSGGPLFNMRGEVVGVTNMKMTFAEGLGFAIPVEMVKYFLEHRDAFSYDNDNPNSGYRYLEPPKKMNVEKVAGKE